MLNIFKKEKVNNKILDTSALVDGRILKILQTGLLEGRIVVPDCVLEELQQLCDSQNIDKRKKGRRGLDIVEEIGKITTVDFFKSNEEMKSTKEVDAKLIIICKELDGKLITVDYTLNKIAKISNVSVLNINDLAQALRPQFVAGDKFIIKVLRNGEQEGQGVGTLEDGTMVIIDDGQLYIGKRIQVEVRWVTQNPSGRLIFTKST